jgi:hypothetical protein
MMEAPRIAMVAGIIAMILPTGHPANLAAPRGIGGASSGLPRILGRRMERPGSSGSAAAAVARPRHPVSAGGAEAQRPAMEKQE